MQRLKSIRSKIIIFILATACFLQAVSVFASGKAAGYRLYVTRFMDGDVIVLDSATGEEMARIGLGFGANPVEVLPFHDNKTLYVSKRGHDEIAVIDAGTNSLKTVIKTGIHPNFMSFSRDWKYLIVATNQGGKAMVIDLESNAVVSEPRVGLGASGVAVTNDNRFAYVTSIYANDISVIDLRRMERVSTIHAPGAIAIVTPPGSHLAYFCSHRDRVSILDTRTNKVVGHIKVGDTPNYITLTPDGGLAFVSNALSGTVSVIDLHGRSVLKNIKVGTEPGSSAISPDGRFVFVTNYGKGSNDSSISVIDVETLEEVDRIKVWRYPRGIAVLPAE